MWVRQSSHPTQCLGEGGPDKQSQVALQEEAALGGGREVPFLLTQAPTAVCSCVASGARGSLVLPNLMEAQSTPLTILF